ncbi:MAG: M28 family peptidase [Cyclobacteriaceae bacterium]|jgi:N-acetylated-alpha-linked acidic dipeptidase|nr:M28 family peptidase [Cyclobacteriaceae bacterium]
MKQSLIFVLCSGVSFFLAAQPRGFSAPSAARQAEAEKLFLSYPSSERFKNHLINLTKEPHVAGTPANERVRDYLASVMRQAGMQVDLYPYDLYLPVGPGEVKAEMVLPQRMPLNNMENIYAEDRFSAHPDLGPGWNAYSGSGDVTAEVVYANYGRKEDFEKLAALNVSCKGKVVIARYGGNFRGYKAKYAQAAGAAALIIYTDPADNGYTKGLVYPEGPQPDESTIQRGSLLTLDFTGDPLTPFEPALPTDGKKKIVRKNPSDVAFHTIPVLPLPYGSAKEIFAQMKGKPVPAGWQGGLPFTYRLEGGRGLTVRVMVKQEKKLQRCYNVVGTLMGSEFPDEWIVAGCHYDAWNFGACDPNSGTAMLLSLSESLGKLAQAGVKPKRTIKIAHWDAEEFGVIGSTEWVEQFREELNAKGVAYFNADAAVSGRSFGGSASPTLKELLLEASKAVTYPDSAKSLYQVWLAGSRGSTEPSVGNLGGGSDHIAFYMHVGIPSWSGGTGGPTLYHSNNDNFAFYERFVDPSFTMGPMVEQVFGVMGLRLANADALPYQLARYGQDVRVHLENLQKQGAYASDFSFERLLKAADELRLTGEAADAALARFVNQTTDVAKRKQINQQLLKLERAWIDADGMPYGKWYRSLYASTDPYSGYASWMLPAFHYEVSLRSSARLNAWEEKYLAAMTRLSEEMKKVTLAAR